MKQTTSKKSQDEAVHITDGGGHSFEDINGHILDIEDRWFERGVKEAIHVKLKQPSLNRRGDLTHLLSATYNAVLTSLYRQLKTQSHLY